MGEDQSNIWTMSYPTRAFFNVCEVYVSLEVGIELSSITMPVLAFACPEDKTVDFYYTQREWQKMPNAVLEPVEAKEANHNIVGAVFSPSYSEPFVKRSVEF